MVKMVEQVVTLGLGTVANLCKAFVELANGKVSLARDPFFPEDVTNRTVSQQMERLSFQGSCGQLQISRTHGLQPNASSCEELMHIHIHGGVERHRKWNFPPPPRPMDGGIWSSKTHCSPPF